MLKKNCHEGLTLETSAFQSLYGGQFTLSTPLINQIFVLLLYRKENVRPDWLIRWVARARHAACFAGNFDMLSFFICI